MALYNTHICVLIVFEVSCESFAKFLFIIMGYYSVSKLEKCHFQMMAINSIYNDGSIKISPQSFNKLYFKTFSVGKLLILIIMIHVLRNKYMCIAIICRRFLFLLDHEIHKISLSLPNRKLVIMKTSNRYNLLVCFIVIRRLQAELQLSCIKTAQTMIINFVCYECTLI